MIHHIGLLDGWLVIERDTGVHVLPHNDIGYHSIDGDRCECETTISFEYGVKIVHHNSYDGRELVDPMTDILQ